MALCVGSAPIDRAAPHRKPEAGGAAEVSGASLDIRLHPTGEAMAPPAEMLLTDPAGRRVGVDPKAGARLLELPGASYKQEGLGDAETGEPGPSTTVLWLPEPPPGEYRLEVVGTAAGRYDLEIQALDRDLAPSRAVRLGVGTAPDAVDRYVIRYSPRPGSKVNLTGPARGASTKVPGRAPRRPGPSSPGSSPGPSR